MVERFLSQTSFTSQEDFIKNLKINVPENFNFGYDVVDAWAAEHPDKPALLWTNDKGEHIQFSFADMKRYCIPLQCRRHQDDCLCRRKRHYRPHHGCHARLSECEEAGQRRPGDSRRFRRFPSKASRMPPRSYVPAIQHQ